MWKCENVEIWKCGNVEMWKLKGVMRVAAQADIKWICEWSAQFLIQVM
jgi:hypothetical protein